LETTGCTIAPEADTSRSKATSPNWRKFWRPCDLVHLLYATDAVEGVFTAMIKPWSSIMPIILDVLYREFCRARLAEMRKQLLLWPGIPVVPEEIFEAGHPDDAATRVGSSQEWDSHAERSHS
jgi:hypothetical protein